MDENSNQASVPLLAVRGSAGLSLAAGYKAANYNKFQRDACPDCKCLAFSRDGSLLAWVSDIVIKVVRLPECQLVHELSANVNSSLVFSPKNSHLASWRPYGASDKKPKPTCNLMIWSIANGEKETEYTHKRRSDWEPQWSVDEEICARVVTDGVLIYKGCELGGSYLRKLNQENVQKLSMSPSAQPISFAIFVLPRKDNPAFVKIFNYPELKNAVCHKSFYKADDISMLWNKTGRSLLLHVSTVIDKTGASYYGEQSLYYMDTEGTTAAIPLAKTGPIYSVEWSPNGKEFCVIYGYVPAKATLYNLKCDPIFEFGSGYRNTIYYNPQGTIICLAGFGNLNGNMEFWNRKELKIITKAEASDTTLFQWSPDGQYFVTATTAPRLRQGNGYKIWHYSGSILHEVSITGAKVELWEVCWMPMPHHKFPPFAISNKPPEGAVIVSKSQAKPAVYRPPSARGMPSRIKLHDDEEFQPASEIKDEDKQISKSALKNKKKREAKAKAKQDTTSNEVSSTPKGNQIPVSAPTASTSENDKKLKNLQRKLRQIESLKEQQNAGKKLEANQLEKLKLEAEIRDEMKKLKLQ